jgi:hypothetical protein
MSNPGRKSPRKTRPPQSVLNHTDPVSQITEQAISVMKDTSSEDLMGMHAELTAKTIRAVAEIEIKEQELFRLNEEVQRTVDVRKGVETILSARGR